MKQKGLCRAVRVVSLALTGVLCSFFLLSPGGYTPASAQSLPPINVDESGLAVRGYDVVAYHTLEKAVQGSPEHAFQWNGATWRFSTSEHLQLFRDDPEKYAPRYGGY
jgi:YHS domain-containing protein